MNLKLNNSIIFEILALMDRLPSSKIFKCIKSNRSCQYNKTKLNHTHVSLYVVLSCHKEIVRPLGLCIFLLLFRNFGYSQQWPIDQADDPATWNRIGGTFGEIHPTGGDHFHGAIDIDVNNLNVPVRSIDNNGLVTDNAGTFVEVEYEYPSNGLYFRKAVYGHVEDVTVSNAELVGQGDILAEVEPSSATFGDHLHLEMWVFYLGDWYRINPLKNNDGWQLGSPEDSTYPEINDVIIQPIPLANGVNSGYVIHNTNGAIQNYTNGSVKVHYKDRPGSTGTLYDQATDKLVIFGNIAPVLSTRDPSVNSTIAAGNGLTVHELSYRINNDLKYHIEFDKILYTDLYFVDELFHTEYNSGTDHSFGNNDFIELRSLNDTYLFMESLISNQRSNGIWNTKAHQSTPDIYSETPFNNASINPEARYSDGNYDLTFQVKDGIGNSRAQDLIVIVDNFRPYIKEVLIKRNDEFGDLVYRGEWEWNGSSLSYVANNLNDIQVLDNVWIKVIASEPVTGLGIHISGVDIGDNTNYPLANPNSNDQEFEFTYDPIATSGAYTLRIQAEDFAGNELQSDPSVIPIRQANGTWLPAAAPGYDVNHSFNVGSGVCVPNSNNNMNRHDELITTAAIAGCLYVDFDADNFSPNINEPVKFTPVVSGSGTLSYNWSFGIGASPPTSTSQFPVTVVYSSAGPKTVSLEICDNTGCLVELKTGYINVIDGSVSETVDFSANRRTIYPGETVQFSGTFTGIANNWNWSFPGGNPSSSTLQNPSVSYASAGQYDVMLTVNGSFSETKTDFITVNNAPTLSASLSHCDNSNFISCPSSYEEFQTVYFRVAVSGGVPPFNYSWNFGDGNVATGTSSTILHGYSNDGVYTARVTVTDNLGTSRAVSTGVTIDPLVLIPTINMDFTASDTYITTGDGPVIFTDQSTSNVDLSNASYYWYFGEGAYPQFAYSKGPHSVCYDDQNPNKSVSLEITVPGVVSDYLARTNFIYVQDYNLFACNAYDPGWVTSPGVIGGGYPSCLFPGEITGMPHGDFQDFSCADVEPGINITTCINNPADPCWTDTWFGSHGTVSLVNGRTSSTTSPNIRLWTSAANPHDNPGTRLQSEGLVYQHFKNFKAGESYRLTFKAAIDSRRSDYIRLMDHLFISLTSGLTKNENCDNGDFNNFQFPQYNFQMYELGQFQYIVDGGFSCYEIDFTPPSNDFDQIWIYPLIEPTLTPAGDPVNGWGIRTGAVWMDDFSLASTGSPVGCPAEITVSAPEIVNNSQFQASLTISTLGEIILLNGQQLELMSGQDIVLNPGFSALPGSSLRLFIDACQPRPTVVAREFNRQFYPTYYVRDHFRSKRFEAITSEGGNFENDQANESFQVYPNPTDEKLTIFVDVQDIGNCRIRISDALGTEIDLFDIDITSADTHELDVSKYAPGIYFVTLKSNDKAIIKKIFVK